MKFQLFCTVQFVRASSSRHVGSSKTAGEDFIAVHPSMFFKHRGLEKRFEGATLELAPFVAEHISGVTPSSHAAAFAARRNVAWNRGAGSRPGDTNHLVELERILQHLDSLAKLAEDGSLSVGSAQVFAAKERIHRLLCDATGNRFARGVICVGGTRSYVLEPLRETCAPDLRSCRTPRTFRRSSPNPYAIVLDRLIGTGVWMGFDSTVSGGGARCSRQRSVKRRADARWLPVHFLAAERQSNTTATLFHQHSYGLRRFSGRSSFSEMRSTATQLGGSLFSHRWLTVPRSRVLSRPRVSSPIFCPDHRGCARTGCHSLGLLRNGPSLSRRCRGTSSPISRSSASFGAVQTEVDR